jgi:hypothetical protein
MLDAGVPDRRPDLYVPYNIRRDAVEFRLAEWLRSLYFTPHDLFETHKLKKCQYAFLI